MNKAVAYLLAMEWSRSLIYLDDHSFHLQGKSGEEYSFQLLDCDVDGMNVILPKVTLQTDYVILLIKNKLGDNCVTAHHYPMVKHIAVGFVQAQELVQHIIFKTRMEVETNISLNSSNFLHEGQAKV